MKASERMNDRPFLRRRGFAARFWASCFLLLFLLLAFSLSALADAPEAGGFPQGFRDIPGITAEEIQAIEKVLAGRKSFSYGALESAECFYRDDGSLDGYTVSLAQMLSRLFGVPFEVEIHTWNDLRRGIRNGDIDFSSDFDPGSGNAQGLLMNRSFRERAIKFVSRAAGSPLAEIARQDKARVAVMRDSAVVALVMPHLEKQYGDKLVIIPIDDRKKVADMLRKRELDLFVADDAWAEIFIGRPDIAVDTFRPLLYKRVAVTTGKPELEPIIRVISKLFPYRKPHFQSLRHIYELHRQGRRRFLHKIFTGSLNEAERAYYDRRIKAGISVPIVASPTNYPVEFYDKDKKRWEGIAFDILGEIGEITDLKFRPVEFAEDNWPLLLKMLRSGDPEAPMLLDVGYNETRARDFIFADKPYLLDHYALISSKDLPNLHHDEVLYHRVGLLQESMFAEVFQRWFPSHADTVYFSAQYEEFKALEEGKIDLLMLSQLHFSYISNFLKRTNFKINMVFEDPLRTGFGFGKAQTELRGIISKAQDLVDTQSIVRRWEYSVLDYRREDAQTRAVLMAISSVFMLLVIALLALLLFQRRREGKRLRAQVAERTRELDEQVEATQAASAAKSRFLANMSHDMRTPLNAIIGLSRLALTDRAVVLDPKNTRSVLNAGLTLLSLVNDLLDISKIEAGRYELTPVDYETPALISDTISINIVRLAGKPITFRLKLDETLPVRLCGDDLRVRQIFNNLLSNALKYTERGEVEWSLSWTKEGDSVWLVSSVRDTGIGIRPESLEKIFSDYNQIDVDAIRKTESTGLGLPIAWNLAKLMDGELTVTSEYGKGSVFSVRLRQGFIDAEPIGPERTQTLRQFQYFATEEEHGGARIVYRDLSHAAVLVVDDVESNLEVAAGMMERYRLRIDYATSGQQAIDMARAERLRYDIIFMDHMMPGMDGVAALKAIREIGTEYAKNVPIVVLTANAIVGNEQRFLESGFQAFLAKPIDMWQLDAVLSRFIQDKAREPEDTLPQAAIPGLDIEAALKRFSGDMKIYRRVLTSWARHTPALLEKAKAVSRETLADYTVVMHGLKGGALSVGATEVSQKAARLEAAAKEGDLAFIGANNADFVEMTARLLASLSAFPAESGEAEKPLKNAPDPETLARLEAAAIAYDMDSVDAALAELESYRYRNRQAFVAWLREQAEAMELSRMAEALAKLNKEKERH
ncbi:MAG: transporter substrate-binding domain-containing protein [Zoogloeaceae bacterium]|jgi:signal transduction histidine kinase/CheY-like chemotaxis protein/HPt (histidine-containing phosphotransfer) domain-containing protein|nr:transporter substrate-binding domain-containing protein [Zoogloeaceae bacterium]